MFYFRREKKKEYLMNVKEDDALKKAKFNLNFLN